MKENIEFTVLIDKLNRMIADFNIKLSQNQDDTNLKNSLEEVIKDKELLYSGNEEDFKKIVSKYGVENNG